MVSVRDGLYRVQVFEAGTGDPLLFLHGAGGLHQGRYLGELAKSFRVIVPEHPGFGASEGLEHIDDVIDLALYYHDFMDELAIESAHIVGHSMGGMLAAELAALCSHRVRRLVLANSIGFWRDEDPVLDLFTMGPDQLVQYTIHDQDSPALREAYPPPESKDDMIEMMYQRIQSYSSAGKFMWPIPDRGLSRRIHRITSPTLILWGESDKLVPPSYAEDFHTSIKDSRVVIMKEAAHMPMFEKCDEFVSIVGEFLNAK